MDLLGFIDTLLHIDRYLGGIIAQYGTITYAILFVIIFCETGLVIVPFLPGDSLLFAAGALSATGSLNPVILVLVLSVAAILGDAVNYQIGHYIGPRAAHRPNRFISHAHLDRAQAFFAKHGSKTIVLARFIPIVRTFVPFVAGVGKMPYRTFAIYNVLGALLWVNLCVFAGYAFGNIPIVKENFGLVAIAIIVISLIPIGWEYIAGRKRHRKATRV